MEEKLSLARKIGLVLAVIQSYVDELFGVLFQKMKSAGDAESKDPKNIPEKILRDGSRFFGDLGDSFYETYEDLKKNKK